MILCRSFFFDRKILRHAMKKKTKKREKKGLTVFDFHIFRILLVGGMANFDHLFDNAEKKTKTKKKRTGCYVPTNKEKMLFCR